MPQTSPRHRMNFCTGLFRNCYAAAAIFAMLALTGCGVAGPPPAGAADTPGAATTAGAAATPGAAPNAGAAAAEGAADGPDAGASTPGTAPARPHVLTAPARYPAAREARVEELLSSMSLERKVSQLLIVELSSPQTGGALVELGPSSLERLRRLQPGGIVLYGGNIESVEQTTALIADAGATAELPLFVAVDEEGGLVSRLRHLGPGEAMRLPSAAAVGATGDAVLAYRAGRALGTELRALGFNMNFAPVVDVAEPGANPFLDSRAYSGDPELVARLSAAFLRGLQNRGVSAAVKHFPGHGTAAEDSHYGVATVSADVQRLSRVDWLPFREAVRAGTDAIMVGHLVVPALTGDATPASVSPAVLEEAARGELGFEGLLISDAVTMGGLSDVLEGRGAAVSVVAAGGDVVLTPANPERARDAIIEAVSAGRLDEARIDASVRRILRVKIDRGILVPEGELFERRFRRLRTLDPAEVLAAPGHRKIVETIRTP